MPDIYFWLRGPDIDNSNGPRKGWYDSSMFRGGKDFKVLKGVNI